MTTPIPDVPVWLHVRQQTLGQAAISGGDVSFDFVEMSRRIDKHQRRLWLRVWQGRGGLGP